MKVRIILALALAMTLSISATAKKKTVAKKAETTKVAKPDTVSVDEFSYNMGLAQTNGLKDFLKMQAGIDSAHIEDFIRGMKEMKDKMNDPAMKAYAMGFNIAQQVFGDFPHRINQQITGKDTTFINEALYQKGFMDALTGAKLPYGVDSAGKICQKQMEFYANEKLERDFGQNRKDGEDFLIQNKKDKDVKVTESGLQYKVIKQGAGPIPTDGATVKVNYKGTLIDGTIFDTTEGKQPFQTNINHVIKGWTEALKLMPVGSKWEIYVPQELAYGAREAGKIKPFSMLIFEIELLEIVDTTKK